MTSSVATPAETKSELRLIFQYTVEAYKTFQKLSELLPNPMSAHTFENFAEDERGLRDLLEIKYSSPSVERMNITLGADLRFQDILEGDLSSKEIAEMLIVRERTMERKLADWSRTAPESERNLYHYIAGTKRAHLALLERELEMLRNYPDWFRREDGESLIVHGPSNG
jgi:hypothetical protein